jgi:DNA polymerase elongation subunit (family B)
MNTLIFDIETIGEEWDSFDDTTKEVLTRWIHRSSDSEEMRQARMRDVKDGLGFSPLTGRIVAIGLYDLERAQGVVFYDASGTTTDDVETGEFTLKPRTEAAMLRDFWDGARSYDTFVTFNGRGFDVPFLLMRSMVHGITPSVDLMEGRYLSQQHGAVHVDLQDQLSFYGATHRREPLHMYCRAFGIESPKQHVSGDDVASLFAHGAYEDIAAYNAKDVTATAELYLRWRDHIAPTSFQGRS